MACPANDQKMTERPSTALVISGSKSKATSSSLASPTASTTSTVMTTTVVGSVVGSVPPNGKGKGGGGLVLNEGQKAAYEGLCRFLDGDVDEDVRETFAATLYGPAGSGKTMLTRLVLNYAKKLGLEVLGVAPTHKACHVLDESLNSQSFLMVPVVTVASLLYKRRKHSYVGTKNFSTIGGNQIGQYNLLIIDESSMITDEEIQQILRELVKSKTKAIFIGDNCQIPSPSQGYHIVKQRMAGLTPGKTITRKVLVKKDACVFDWEEGVYSLYEIMRQKDDNPLIDIFDFLRLNIHEEITDQITRKSALNSRGDGVILTAERHEFIEHIVSEFQRAHAENRLNPFTLKIIAYTNKSIRKYNRVVRQALNFHKHQFVNGELLMGYSGVGWPTQLIENGQDYKVIDIHKTRSHQVKEFGGLVGLLVTVIPVRGKLGSEKIDSSSQNVHFFPEISAPENYEVFEQLMKLAKRVENHTSSPADYKTYKQLKDQLIFMDNVYWYDGKIMDETTLEAKHPALKTNVSDCIGGGDSVNSSGGPSKRVYYQHKLTQILKEQYPLVLKYRYDDPKPIGDSETFMDRFQIIEKDIDYGYAITAHKAQGSNIHTVFIDETGFAKIKDRYNYREKMLESRTKEKNQLRYVAYTRPTSKAYVFFRPTAVDADSDDVDTDTASDDHSDDEKPASSSRRRQGKEAKTETVVDDDDDNDDNDDDDNDDDDNDDDDDD